MIGSSFPIDNFLDKDLMHKVILIKLLNILTSSSYDEVTENRFSFIQRQIMPISLS